MNKSILVLGVCGVLVISLMFFAYEFGASNSKSSGSYTEGFLAGNSTGYNQGYLLGQQRVTGNSYNAGLFQGNQTGFADGYQAGFQDGLAAQNKTGP